MNVLALAADTSSQVITAGAALCGAIIGVLGTLATTVWQDRRAQAVRKADAETARRERAAAILGRVRTFLTDADPVRIGINVNPETTPQALEALKGRLDTLRDELSVFGAAADDDRVMVRAAELEVALFSTFHFVTWHAHDLLGHVNNVLRSLERAQLWHLKANTLVTLVLDLVRGREVAELEHAVAESEKQLRRLDQLQTS